MDIAAIDQWANSYTSPLHRASALGKGLAAIFVVAAVALAWSPFLLLGTYLLLLAGVFLTRLPARSLVGLAAYPAIFAALFALSRLDGTWTTPAVILLKAITAAQAMVLLIATTPYPDIFAPLGRALPRLVADGLFITYRSLFMLLEEMAHVLTALRLRGGLRQDRPLATGANIARSLGMLLIRAIDLSERLYEVLRLRGYRGRIAPTGRWHELATNDALPLAAGAVALAASLLAVVLPAVWIAASGYYLVATGLLAVATLAWSASRRPAALPATPSAAGESLRSPTGDRQAGHAHGVGSPDGPRPAAGHEVARVSCVRHLYPDGTEVSLCGLDFVAHQGESIVILGPNGAGKSTLLFHLLGLLRPDEGSVTVLGRDPARDFAALQPHLGVLVQNAEEQLLGPTVADDVAFGARNAGFGEEEVAARTQRVMRRLGVEHLGGKVVHYLSGGEKRKVALAGALVTDPDILILDEPFEGLDPRSRADLVSLLGDLRRETGMTVILTTHDVDLVPKLADTVYVLAEGGHIVARGTPEEVFHHRELLAVSNIEAPALTVLFHRLRDAGLDLGTPTDMDDAARRLIALVQGGPADGRG